MIGDGKVMSSLGPREKLSKDSPYYKATDFRQLQIIRRRKEAAEKARERRDRLQQLADVKTISRSTVTIDTSKAKSNSEIVRICSEDLGWKEVTDRYMYTYVCMYVCIYVLIYVCMYVCIYICMHGWMYACLYVCICM